MINLNDVTVFNDIRERLAAVTPAQIKVIERRLKIEKEGMEKLKRIGTIESETTRALFCLSRMLDAQHELEEAQAKCAEDAVVQKDHEEKAVLLDILSDVARELFWAQAKIDLGLFISENIGVRENWEVVILPARPNPGTIIQGIMAAGFEG